MEEGGDMFEWNNAAHVVFGSLALAGGFLALVSAKGATWHVRGGWLFVWAMGLVVLTTFVQMLHNFLPLAIVMCVAVLYLIPSGLLSLRRDFGGFTATNLALSLLPAVLAVFAAVQFVRFNLRGQGVFLGPGLLALTFGFLCAQDWIALRERPTHPNVWIRRHLLRMILAFTFAVMALVRIGVDFGLSFEATVIYPLLLAGIAIAVVYRRYPVRRPAAALRRAT